MQPLILEIGTLKFHAYPMMLSIAFIVSTLLAVREMNRGDNPYPATPQGGLFGFVGALIGAKVFWILQYSEVKYLYHAFFVWEGGLVYYGGLIGGILGAILYVRLNRFPYWRTADCAAPFLALGQAITRVGCFLNGCCWGIHSEHLPWAVNFPRKSPAFRQQLADGLISKAADGPLPVHPTQLYMVFGLLLIVLVLKLGLMRPRRFHGSVALGYCFLYGILRFVVESFRGDSARSIFTLTVSQTISLGLIVGSAAIYLAVISYQRKRALAEGAGEMDDIDNANEEDAATE